MKECNRCLLGFNNPDCGFQCSKDFEVKHKRVMDEKGYISNVYYSERCELMQIVFFNETVFPKEIEEHQKAPNITTGS